MNITARTVVSILLALAILPLGAGPVQAANLVHGTVTLAGDSTTPMNGYINARPEGSLNSSGWNLTNGTFSVGSITDGDYKFFIRVATMDGLTRWYAEGVPGGVADAASATVIHLSSSNVTLDWVLDPIATLSGTVKDDGGTGIAGADVLINRLGSVRSTKADGSGAYTFGYVRSGTVTMAARGPQTLAGVTRQVVLPAIGPAVEDFVLLPKGHIEGTVTDADSGDPIAHIDVSAFTTLHNYNNSATTDADGHFAFDVDPDSYVLRFDDSAFASYPGTFNGGALVIDDATPFAVASGATVTRDEVLTAKPDPRLVAHALGGVVMDAGNPAAPLAGIEVTASHGVDMYTTTTDRLGRWALGTPDAPLPDQSYLLRAGQGWQLDNLHPDLVPWFPEYYPNAWTPATATAITVAGDTQDGIDMALERAARLSVTVSAAGTGALHTGYRVVTSTGVLAADVPATASSPASPAVLLRPGTWKILASGFRGDTAPGTRLLPKWLGGGVSVATAGSYTVASGQERSTAVTLPSALRATTAPRIKGTPRVGRTLTATKGTWNLMTGTTFKFVWLRGTKVIGRKATHVVVRADRGRTIKVRVTAINGTFRTTITRKIRVP